MTTIPTTDSGSAAPMATPTASAACLALANRLRPAVLKIHRHLRSETHALGVRGGQVIVLAQVRDNPGIGIGDLAAREGMAAPSMCTHIDRLESLGLVARTRSETDRRRVGLTITAEGERVLRTVRSRRTAWLASRLQTCTDDERATIDAAVDALLALVSDV